ncbi:uncharacterized protein B0I36DRAFT_73533 [Microdochium trichocladiopsis]|uniref:Uncharacterized protein n=1 Tax=Microdochium trichocladiopsis TaxID=1682393 RepID=A0A9P8YFJ6_9PEZI|nr:uncharacterized protein B0I36DRAFT_73533 [Microdochium trichocladiopsis]KAH7037982.1 hypothetical protein B0I36DRAFT_73533 [Microdochium trichocladiopsis]
MPRGRACVWVPSPCPIRARGRHPKSCRLSMLLRTTPRHSAAANHVVAKQNQCPAVLPTSRPNHPLSRHERMGNMPLSRLLVLTANTPCPVASRFGHPTHPRRHSQADVIPPIQPSAILAGVDHSKRRPHSSGPHPVQCWLSSASSANSAGRGNSRNETGPFPFRTVQSLKSSPAG